MHTITPLPNMAPIPEEDISCHGGKHRRMITRPFHHLLKLKKDLVRLPSSGPSAIGGGIKKASSFKLPGSNAPMTKSTAVSTTNGGASEYSAFASGINVASTGARDFNNKDQYSSRGPGAPSVIKPPTLITRAATFRTVRTNPSSTFSPKYLEDKESPKDKQYKDPMPGQYTASYTLAECFLQSDSGIQPTEDLIRRRLQYFPSVLQQQARGSNFIPNWSWTTQLAKLLHDTQCCQSGSCCRDAARVKLSQFYFQVNQASTLLEQIRLDFQYGILYYGERSNNYYDDDVTFKSSKTNTCQSLLRDLSICRSTRSERGGRMMLSAGTMEYIHDIFYHEITKQSQYCTKWMNKTLTSSQDIKKRDEIVGWVLKAAATLKYPAETAHLAVYFIDAFLTKGNRLTDRAYNLLGIGALQIAGKLEEPEPASLSRLTRLQCTFFKVDEVNWMERLILEKLQFDLYPPMAPLFAQMVLFGGSLEFPNVNLKKLVMDLSMGILYKSLLNHKLFVVRPSDKAQAALEIATEYIFFQHKLYSRRDLSRYDFLTSEPGKEAGDLALDLCTQALHQRFLNRKVTPVFGSPVPGKGVNMKCPLHATPSPRRDVKV